MHRQILFKRKRKQKLNVLIILIVFRIKNAIKMINLLAINKFLCMPNSIVQVVDATIQAEINYHHIEVLVEICKRRLRKKHFKKFLQNHLNV